MNKSILMGRLTRDPEVRVTESGVTIGRYTLAVDRRRTSEGGQAADFISCVAIGKCGEFAEKYLHKGIKIVVTGRIQTGSYEKDGQRIYTTDVIVEEQEFAESKQTQQGNGSSTGSAPTTSDGFMSIPDGIEESLPFN
jgi:single-strand DNA-binding protein